MLHPVLLRERLSVSAYLDGAIGSIGALLPQVQQNTDAEALHQFRVGLRRIRTVLKIFAAKLPLGRAAEIESECAWLAGRSGGLRECDVLRLWLTPYLEETSAVDAVTIARLQRELDRLRKREWRAFGASLRSQRAQRLLQALQDVIGLDPAQSGWAGEPIAGRVLWRAYRRVVRQGRKIGIDTPPAELHLLRKRCKRLRYLCEMFAGTYAPRVMRKLIGRLRKLQDLLGDFQDFDTHRRLLLQLRENANVDPALKALIEELGAVIDRHALAARGDFEERFARFAQRKQRHRWSALFVHAAQLKRPHIGTNGYCHALSPDTPSGLPVGKLVCVGRNYAAHAAELGNPVPETPLLFIKPAAAAVDFAPWFRIPKDRGSVHHELEIAVLIGRELSAASADEARAAIAGIGLGIDLTLRDLQDQLKSKSHPWEVAKGFDGACPLSPFVALPPEVDLGALEFRLVVNGRRRQFGNSAQMLTPIIDLLCYASRQFSLWPGDVLLTGTPKGVGPLQTGDRVGAELYGFLMLRTVVV